MDHEPAYKAQILSRARGQRHRVTTFLLCRNTLLHTGIAHLLSGTRFAVADGASINAFDIPITPDGISSLVLVCESLSQDGYLELIEIVKNQHPTIRLVLLCEDLDPQSAAHLLDAGLDGVCRADMAQAAMVKALELVMLGERYLPASMGLALLEQLPGQREFTIESMLPSVDPWILTDRERQIVRQLTLGASNKMIGKELGLSEATIKVHLKAILRKLGAANRTQAALWARAHFTTGSETRVVAAEG